MVVVTGVSMEDWETAGWPVSLASDGAPLKVGGRGKSQRHHSWLAIAQVGLGTVYSGQSQNHVRTSTLHSSALSTVIV